MQPQTNQDNKNTQQQKTESRNTNGRGRKAFIFPVQLKDTVAVDVEQKPRHASDIPMPVICNVNANANANAKCQNPYSMVLPARMCRTLAFWMGMHSPFPIPHTEWISFCFLPRPICLLAAMRRCALIAHTKYVVLLRHMFKNRQCRGGLFCGVKASRLH